MFTDTSYIRRIQSTVKNHVANSKSPIFFFVFSFDGKANIHKRLFDYKQPGKNVA